MNCKKCGNLLDPNAEFCQFCGERVIVVPTSQPVEPVMQQPVQPMMQQPVQPEPVMQQPVQPEPVMQQPVQPEPVMQQPVQPVAPAQMAAAPAQPIGVQQPVAVETPKKGNKLFIIIVIVLVLVAGALVAFFFLKDKDGETNKTPTNNTNVVEPDEPPVNTIDNNGSKITFANYEFVLPEGYVGVVQGETLQLVNNTKQVKVAIMTLPGYNMEDVFDEKDEFKKAFEDEGSSNVRYTETTIDGNRVLVYTFETSGITINQVFVDLKPYSIATFAINNQGSDSNDNIISEIAKMILAAKGGSSFSPDTDNNEISLPDIDYTTL